MIKDFSGPHSYNQKIVSDWDSSGIGVYYCGAINTEGKLVVYYIGRAVSDKGIRGRLLEHLGENKWYDITHFGFHYCDTVNEACDFEMKEIATYKPKYNIQGK